MRRSSGWRVFAVVGAFAVLLVMSGGASAVDVQHGIGLTKGCSSPTKVGDPYTCAFSVRNVLDEAEDTLTIHSLTDTVHAAGGDIGGSTNILPLVKITTLTPGGLPSGATCVATGGDGSAANPYTGTTMCTLPFGSRLQVLPFSHYTVQPADYNLPGHLLTDDAKLDWNDLCDDPAGTGNPNCNPDPPDVGAASQSVDHAVDVADGDDIHNAAHQVVTAVAVGTTVHDFVTVTGQPGAARSDGERERRLVPERDLCGCAGGELGQCRPVGRDGSFRRDRVCVQVQAAGLPCLQGALRGRCDRIVGFRRCL